MPRQPSFKTFRSAVDRELTARYGLTWADAGGDAQQLAAAITLAQTPADFVRWWGEKYDLTPREQWK